MMRITFKNIAALLLAGMAFSVPVMANAAALTQAPTFAGIAWGTSADQVKADMLSRGFTFDTEASQKDTDKDLWFKGSVQGQSADIAALFDGERHLVRMWVEVLTADQDCQPIYNTLVANLTAKYGKPSDQTAKYSPPFQGGPNDFIPAVKADKAMISTDWYGTIGTTFGIDVEVSDRLVVDISYNSDNWHAERLRRNHQPDANL